MDRNSWQIEPTGTAAGRVVLVGSGTAGHVYPALALAEHLRKEHPEIEPVFIGTAKGQELRLLEAEGHRVRLIEASPYHGDNSRLRLRIPRDLAVGIRQARSVLAETRPQAVIAFGGYTSFSVVVAARLSGVPVVIHEANAVPGLANRLSARFAKRICVGMEPALSAFPRNRTVHTGTPVRAEILRASRQREAGPDPVTKPKVLVTGGSEGSPFFNERIPHLLGRLYERGAVFDVEHHTGGDIDTVAQIYHRAGIAAEVRAWSKDMASSYATSTLAITRAGALTLTELAAVGLPAFLIPLPDHAADHQTRNAEEILRAGGLGTDERRWNDGSVEACLAELLESAATRKRVLAALRRPYRADAARQITAEALALGSGPNLGLD